MTIARSIESKLVEGVAALLAADTDIADDYSLGGVNLGPLNPSPDGDSIVKPRQINVMLAPDLQFSPGVGGSSSSIVSVVIAMYDYPDLRGYAAGGVTPYDRMIHAQKILATGSDGSNNGKIIDPDNADSLSNVTKYLNTTMPDFTTVAMGSLLKSNRARLFAFMATYQTREDNTARTRA